MTTSATDSTGASDAELMAGTLVGDYKIEGVIGRGGFGTVYRAVHPLIGKQVAIKVLAHRFSYDAGFVSRFHAEAKAVNQIQNRNIIDIFSFGQLADGRSYYAMELLEGEPLDRRLAAGPLPLRDALRVLRPIARALDAAHAKGIAHRDIKPENVFLARDGDGSLHPKLLDFGIAKLLAPDADVGHRTNTGVPLGTPYYMSPEQCRGRDIDHRTDMYSFGVMTYRVLTGQLPFTGDFMELMNAHVGREPVPPSRHVPSLPPTVDAAVAWMMRKDRAARPPTLTEAVATLDPGAPTTVPPPTRTKRPSGTPAAATLGTVELAPLSALELPAPRRRRLVVGAIIVFVVALAATWWVVSASTSSSPSAATPPVAPAPSTSAPAASPTVQQSQPPAAVTVPTNKPKQVTSAPAGSGSEPPAHVGTDNHGDHNDIIHLSPESFGSGH